MPGVVLSLYSEDPFTNLVYIYVRNRMLSKVWDKITYATFSSGCIYLSLLRLKLIRINANFNGLHDYMLVTRATWWIY